MKLSSVFNKTVFPLAVTILSATSFAEGAEAATLSGSVSGSWQEPLPGIINENPVYTGVETDTFTWGDATPFENAFPNELMFEGNSFSTDTGSLFKLGDLSYTNGTVSLGSSVESVPLSLSLSFDESTEVDAVFQYEFYLENTVNNFVDPEEDADRVYFANNDLEQSFIYNGNPYTFTLAGFSQDDGKTTSSELKVLEGETTATGIFAKIEPVSVSKQIPEPGFVVAFSLIGVYLISWKKATKTK